MSTAPIVSKPIRSLDLLIRDALHESPSADPRDVVDAVVAAIPARLREHYLREAVLWRSSQVSARSRASVAAVVVAPSNAAKSRKAQIIRDEWWPRFLRQRVLVGGEYKFLADVSAADLRVVAGQRRDKIRELEFHAAQLESLADLMDAQGASRLADLSEASASVVVERAA